MTLLSSLSPVVLPRSGAGQQRRDEHRAQQNQPDLNGEVSEASGHLPDAGRYILDMEALRQYACHATLWTHPPQTMTPVDALERPHVLHLLGVLMLLLAQVSTIFGV